MTESKGNDSKSINVRVMIFVLCTSSNVKIHIKFHKASLNSFQVIEQLQFCDSVQGF